jgi:hypothetical protein
MKTFENRLNRIETARQQKDKPVLVVCEEYNEAGALVLLAYPELKPITPEEYDRLCETHMVIVISRSLRAGVSSE